MSGEEWRWQFTDGCRRDLEGLDEYARERIISKLDEIVIDQWRDPGDYLDRVMALTPPGAASRHPDTTRSTAVDARRRVCRAADSSSDETAGTRLRAATPPLRSYYEIPTAS